MYIPPSRREPRAPTAAPRHRDTSTTKHDDGKRLLPIDRSSASRHFSLQRRQFSSNGTDNANIRTGLIIGLVLAIFLIGACAFCFFFRKSLRLTKKKRRRRRRRYGSKSSKSSKSSKHSNSSGGGGAAPEAAPAEEPPPEEAPPEEAPPAE